MKRVLVTGATGLIGKKLVEALVKQGIQVNTIGRSYAIFDGARSFVWDVKKGYIDPEALSGVGHIIHLAGAGIADGHWTDSRKLEIIQSRIKPVEMLFEACIKSGTEIKTFISSSGINYYGSETTTYVFTENAPPGTGFLSDVCVQWEDAAQRFADLGSRVVCMRTGVVLAKNGGALKVMARPILMGIGSAIGTGRQWVPWVHINDAVSAYMHVLQNAQTVGAYNLCAPQHITNKELTRAIALTTKRILLLPNVPAVALKTVMGEMAAMILEGSRASSAKLEATGFSFHYHNLQQAMREIYG